MVLNRIKESDKSPIAAYYPKATWNVASARTAPEDGRLSRIDLANRANDKDDNVNGKRGTLRNQKRVAEEEERPQGGSSGNVKVKLTVGK